MIPMAFQSLVHHEIDQGNMTQARVIWGPANTKCPAQVRFHDNGGVFPCELTYDWHRDNLYFHHNWADGTISAEDKNEMIRLTFAGPDADRIRLNTDESIPSQKQHEIHFLIFVRLQQGKRGK
jgi:hypothetical protein